MDGQTEHIFIYGSIFIPIKFNSTNIYSLPTPSLTVRISRLNTILIKREPSYLGSDLVGEVYILQDNVNTYMGSFPLSLRSCSNLKNYPTVLARTQRQDAKGKLQSHKNGKRQHYRGVEHLGEGI